MDIINQIYDENSAKLIDFLYKNDIPSRTIFLKTFGQRIIEKQEDFINAKPLDILSLICMTASFADSKEECHEVAIIFFKRLKDSNPLPYLTDGQNFLFAEKTLVALSIYKSAMEKRWSYRGAPSPKYYRSISKLIFEKNGKNSIANHHEMWENFFSEIFI